MRRRRLIELHEQTWFPRNLRETVTLLLQFLLNLLGYYRIAAPLLLDAIQRTGSSSVVDLCSGSGGPWFELAPLLNRVSKDREVSVYLTDKFPTGASSTYTYKSAHQVAFWTESIDAERVPQALTGFRTIFNSFHHFEPARAMRILRDAVKRREGIAIFEVPRRDFLTFCSAALMALGTFVFSPLIKPFRFSAFLWTYIVPVIPFVMWFDGVVSCLRSYTPPELRQLAEAASHEYLWIAGTLVRKLGLIPIRVTYLVGLPPPNGETRQGTEPQVDQLADAARAGSERIASIAASISCSLL